MLDLNNTGGTFDRQPNSTHVVSLWHIPHGSEYHLATVNTVFFSDEVLAEAFEKHWSMPPEMAMLVPINLYDMIEEKRLASNPCSDCGQPKDSHIDRFDARPGQCDTWQSSPMTDNVLAAIKSGAVTVGPYEVTPRSWHPSQTIVDEKTNADVAGLFKRIQP